MIQDNNNLSVLPFYTDMSYQNHRLSYAYGNIYPLFVSKSMLIPFQILRQTRAASPLTVNLYNEKSQHIQNITQQLTEAGLKIIRFENFGYDVILFPGIFPFVSNMPEGFHYITINDGTQIFYSEMFTAVNTLDGYLCIEWFDQDDLIFDAGRVVYDGHNFKNRLYVCSEIGKPEYTFEEVGENRDGYYFSEKQISEKTYKFTFIAPEFICDVMRLIRLSDFVNVYSKGRNYKCDTFLMTPKWQTQGDLASVEVEFQTATVVKKIGRGYVSPLLGDFNNDFNNDFN